MREYPEIRAHYEAVAEKDRLASPHGRLELLRTQHVLRTSLPRSPATVYDVGGGTGPYSSWLAELGYDVHLIDLVPKHVTQSREANRGAAMPIRSFAVGDARKLEVASEVADAVLLLGPLYHLPERDDRIACWREAARILRPGGVVAAAILSRFASLLDGLSRNLVADPRFVEMLEQDLATGVHVNRTENPEYFTTAYLQPPDEATEECATAGLEVERVVGIEGPAWLFGDVEACMRDDAAQARLLEFLARIESEPALLGVSAHLVVVASKPV